MFLCTGVTCAQGSEGSPYVRIDVSVIIDSYILPKAMLLS